MRPRRACWLCLQSVEAGVLPRCRACASPHTWLCRVPPQVGRGGGGARSHPVAIGVAAYARAVDDVRDDVRDDGALTSHAHRLLLQEGYDVRSGRLL